MAAFGESKQISKSSLDMTKGGSSGRSTAGADSAEDRANSGSGPTGSSRSYPKSSSMPGDTQNAPFNPQKAETTDIYVGGVGGE